MMNKKEKMVKIAHDVFWGKGDTDHPSCPECGSTMNFFGGDDVPFGDAVWKCPDYLGLHYPKDKWKLIDFPVKEMLKELEKSLKTDKTSEKKKTKKVDKKVKSTEKPAEGRAGE